MPNIDGLISDKQKFVYDNPTSKKIFTPLYSAYNQAYFTLMSDKFKVKESFEHLKDTSWWEQYMVNSFQFSAAKDRTEMKLMQENVYDENKSLRTFSDFKNIVQSTNDLFNKTWTRTEYDLASHNAIMADVWTDMIRDKDINPNWIYHCADAPCEICEPMDGEIFSLDDDEAAELFGSNHWNCLCWSEPTDDDKTADGKDYIDNVPEQFQANPAEDGLFNLEGSSYGDVLPSANDADQELFAAHPKNFTTLNTRRYNDYQLLVHKETLKKEFPLKGNDTIFQNKDFMLNVRLPHDVLKAINKKAAGIENVHQAITKPSEIWAHWENEKEQKTVLMNYVLFSDKKAYIVETKKGVVVDAYIRQHTDSKNLRRKGILLIK